MPINFQAGTTASPATRTIRFTQPLTVIDLSAEVLYRATAGEGESVTDRDANLDQVVSAPQVTDYQMRLETFGGVYPATVTWSSSNEAVATVDTEGYVTHVSDGVASITATVNGVAYDSDELTLSTNASATTGTLVSYVTGSLAKDATDAVDTRLAGKSAANALRIFTTQDHATPAYARNTSCWAYDIDLTPISPWNSVGANTRAGTLISPRHIIFAAHYEIPAGAAIRFVQTDNTVVTRTISSIRRATGYAPYYPDYTVGLLDSDVPAGVSFAKVLPDDYANQLPALRYSRTVPALCLDQEEKAIVTDWANVASSGAVYAQFAAPNNLNYEKRLEFYEEKIGGDSGNPAFLILGGELVLLTVWTFGGAGTGTFLTSFISDINAAMTELGGGYQLTTADLSGYNDYS